MQVHYNIDKLPVFRKAVVTIGTFDGVHAGHRKVLQQLMEEADKIDGESLIITFHPHPRKVIRTGQSPLLLINTIEEKIELLEATGIHHLVIVPFTEMFSKFTATQYVEDFLIGRFHPHTIIIGYDHHFGRGREGNYKLLEEYSARNYFTLREIPELLIHQNSVSSTAIRNTIQKGQIDKANELLSYEFFFEGNIIEGNKIGRTIGFPTANISVTDEEKVLPGIGVYAVRVEIKGRVGEKATEDPPRQAVAESNFLNGMMNIGRRPTVDGTTIVIEVHLFNFSQDIYNQQLRVYVVSFLRKEQKFDGLDQLKEQLALDKKSAIQILI